MKGPSFQGKLSPKMFNLRCLLQSLPVHSDQKVLSIAARSMWNCTHLDRVNVKRNKKTPAKNYRRMVFYPTDHKGDLAYTVEPLYYRHLAGRDPVSGRVIVDGLGGGIKEKVQWVHIHRQGPTDDSPPKQEKVLQIIKTPSQSVRTADLALVGDGDFLKLILATENMKAGDIIKTSQFIPRIAVRASEGDAYPVGALPLGSRVCCVEKFPGEGAHYARSAGNSVLLVRNLHDTIVIQLPSKQEVAISKHCMAVVGRISNPDHINDHIGTPNRLRELGNRPRSGLWQRKTGHDGRKIRPLPPLKIVKRSPEYDTFQLTMPTMRIKTKALNKKTGLGGAGEQLYEEKLRRLRREEEALGARNGFLMEKKDSY
uniref:39S ribosomal protein L2, mitochondrial n=2 Tax=Cacopsylla melanoneura TaxID=428564 RepID=A0A8D8W7A3_9HEMI